jgi:hypothetical protein
MSAQIMPHDGNPAQAAHVEELLNETARHKELTIWRERIEMNDRMTSLNIEIQHLRSHSRLDSCGRELLERHQERFVLSNLLRAAVRARAW